ncbi:hypothetical protein D4R78_05435 [bacterium]|nr:MAG: hypothetical protein D4R78_05435 [bacterium]
MVICMAKKAQFNIHAPGAKRVSLAGNFNNWDTKVLQAKKDSKGNWMVKASLKPGRYEYKFFVDGSWMSDPSSKSFTTNAFGTQNCVIEVK